MHAETSERVWFFVSTVAPNEYEVQLLNDSGQATATARFMPGISELKVGGQLVPVAVVRAAESTAVIGSQYVNAQGELLDFYGQPLRQQSR